MLPLVFALVLVVTAAAATAAAVVPTSQSLIIPWHFRTLS